MPRAKDPDVADRLLEAAARLLAADGPQAVTARRLAAEIGTSTMAVYTHFGSMDDLLVRLWRHGFARFGAAIDAPPSTEDPVADWIAQGWAYRRFALDNPHLYRVMFGAVMVTSDDPADQAAAAATFTSLVTRLQRAVDGGRLTIPDPQLAAQVVWATVHGHVTLELDGYNAAVGHDAVAVYTECMRRMALGFGDDPAAVERSLARAAPGSTARRRPRRVVAPTVAD